MHSSFHKSLLQEETRYKDDVYRYLDEEIQEAKENVAEKSAAVIGAHSKLRMLLFRTGSSVVRTKI